MPRVAGHVTRVTGYGYERPSERASVLRCLLYDRAVPSLWIRVHSHRIVLMRRGNCLAWPALNVVQRRWNWLRGPHAHSMLGMVLFDSGAIRSLVPEGAVLFGRNRRPGWSVAINAWGPRGRGIHV